MSRANNRRHDPRVRPLKNPLQYIGGKQRLAPWIISHFPPHEVYVEMFGGAASVLLTKPPSPLEVYNDVDDAVVTFWRMCRTRPQALARQMALTPWSFGQWQRDRSSLDDRKASSLERARRFLVSSRQSFRGMVERGGWSRVRDLSRTQLGAMRLFDRLPERIQPIAERLKPVQLECADWSEIVSNYDGRNVLFYCDPPYDPAVCDSLVMYRRGFTTEQHVQLLTKLSRVKAAVVLSGYPSELYSRHLRGWRRVVRDYRAPFANGAARQECLWIKPAGHVVCRK